MQQTWDSPLYISRAGSRGVMFKKIVFICPKIFFTFTNSEDQDEMQHNAAFHLGLHFLQKDSFRGFPNTKGYNCILPSMRICSVLWHIFGRVLCLFV